jgi:tetratricopeptide (TPR) repeat protein
MSPTGAETTDGFDSTHSLVGSYLSGRFAKAQHDMTSAADFYRAALVHDPSSELLLEQAFQMEASQANWTRAIKLADELVAVQEQHRTANLALGLSAFKDKSYKKAEARFRAAGTGPIGELTSALALAWVKVAEGDTTKALALLDMPKQAEWAQFYLRYHRALIADVGGRPQEAKNAYERVLRQDNTRTLRTTLAYARSAAHAGDKKAEDRPHGGVAGRGNVRGLLRIGRGADRGGRGRHRHPLPADGTLHRARPAVRARRACQRVRGQQAVRRRDRGLQPNPKHLAARVSG